MSQVPKDWLPQPNTAAYQMLQTIGEREQLPLHAWMGRCGYLSSATAHTAIFQLKRHGAVEQTLYKGKKFWQLTPLGRTLQQRLGNSLTSGEAWVLLVLENSPPLTNAAIRKRLAAQSLPAIHRGTLRQTLQNLQFQELVQETRENARVVTYSLTPQGTEMLTEAAQRVTPQSPTKSSAQP